MVNLGGIFRSARKSLVMLKPIFVEGVQAAVNTHFILKEFEVLDVLRPSDMRFIRAMTGIPGALYYPGLSDKPVAVRIVHREAPLLYSHALPYLKFEFAHETQVHT